MKKASLILLIIALMVACTQKGIEFKTDQFRVSLSEKGFITALADIKSGRNYLAENQSAPLIQIRNHNKYILPDSCSVDRSTGIISLTFDGKRTAKIQFTAKRTHLVFTLKEISGADSLDLIVWGPYPTTIGETIGETVGVVRDSVYAIGIQSLNLKTLGGYPTEENDIEPSYDISETNNLIDVADSVKVLYRGQTARKEPFGSVIQAYCRNRNKDRIISNWGHEYYVAPAFHDGGVNGSSIAIFGCKAGEALKTIGEIEIQEDLPHPMIDGEWGKTARSATDAYLIMNFGYKDFEEVLSVTKKAGLKYLYHQGPFDTWGHFKMNPDQFPENWITMEKMVRRAAEVGIRLGVHTLSNFITTDDLYVTPNPDSRLARVGSSKITHSIGPGDKTIGIEDPKFFNQMKSNTLRCVMIENELIQYTAVSDSPPWVLTDCKRGSFGTTPLAHESGADIGKLLDHPYRTFLTNNELSDAVSIRLGDFFNMTGCRMIGFDGLEGNWSTGMGEYGCLRFVQNWYDMLRPELKGQVITSASGPGHFFWHSATRFNWGEPWYAGFRESQTNYRLLNQLYFQRNLLPSMLGWFRMTPETSIEDIEWLLARSAGFDAGFALVTSLNAVGKNAFGDKILDAVKEWEGARMAGAFPAELKKRMQNIKNEFHLEADGPGKWNLFPFTIWRAEYKPGSGPMTIEVDNGNPDQTIQFVLASGPENSATGISLVIDGGQKIPIPLDLPANHYIKYTGGSYAYLYDSDWNLVNQCQLTQYYVTLTQGKHKLDFEASFKTAGSGQGIKIEMKTAGLAYQLKKQQ